MSRRPTAIIRRKALSRSKYGNKRVKVGERTFDSKGEAARAMELRLMEKAELIHDLQFQVTFRFEVNGHDCGAYRADFTYTDADGVFVVEDFKSPATTTDLYRLKKKLMRACHGIEVRESYARRGR